MRLDAKWIRTSADWKDVCPVFVKMWIPEEKEVRKAILRITALGVYEARINGRRVGDFILAPGWTAYEKRLQVQEYDVTQLLGRENCLEVTVGKGWYASPMPGWIDSEEKRQRAARKTGLIAELRITYENGTESCIGTDESWSVRESPVRFSEIYDGEIYDARYEEKEDSEYGSVVCFDGPYDALIPQEGEEVREAGTVACRRIFTTPAGETVVDFGQEITGYVEFEADAAGGETIRILHGEVLDRNGNFYNDNYRSAKAEILYTCRAGHQVWHPHLTFFGFRYLKVEGYPGVISPERFRGVVVCSEMKRTGWITTGHKGMNRLISNVIWGQRGNFLDVPTDCPQRDERLGWTGDAQVFTKAATLNFDVERFFIKWLHDLAAEQRPDGGVCHVVPDYLPDEIPSAAWGDSGVIIPWQIYQTYGNEGVLRDQFDSMKRWIEHITRKTTKRGLWLGGRHLGDWLGLDAPFGSYKGSSREDFVASAYYANSTALLVKAGRVLGEDVSAWEALHEEIRTAFREEFPVYLTQTEHVLALWAGLCEDPQKTADALAEMIRRDGSRMKTGFVGTPYILHVLSEHGYADLAYDLLLREEFPSWLYSVNKGATTVWEHWDGITEEGEFWSRDMNSFNHYAYGSVIDWIYEKAAGIRHEESAPGFARAVIAPIPDRRLGYLEARLEARNGTILSSWCFEGDAVRYDISTEMPAVVVIDGTERCVEAGEYVFWGKA